MADPHELDDEARMPFVEHLRELRVRLRNSILALIGGFCIALGFLHDHIVAFLVTPCVIAWQRQQPNNEALGDPTFYNIDFIGTFWSFLSLDLFAGAFIASPFIFHQLWQFIAPGLYKHERRYGLAFAFISVFFFVGGAIFCYYMVLPLAFDFFLGYSTDNLATVGGQKVALEALPDIGPYLSLERRLLFGFGLVFELPLVIFFLSLAGAVTHRGLWRFNRWWIVVSFVLAAILTPPDIISQVLMAGPLIVLYNLSIIVSWIITVRRERKQAALGMES